GPVCNNIEIGRGRREAGSSNRSQSQLANSRSISLGGKIISGMRRQFEEMMLLFGLRLALRRFCHIWPNLGGMCYRQNLTRIGRPNVRRSPRKRSPLSQAYIISLAKYNDNWALKGQAE